MENWKWKFQLEEMNLWPKIVKLPNPTLFLLTRQGLLICTKRKQFFLKSHFQNQKFFLRDFSFKKVSVGFVWYKKFVKYFTNEYMVPLYIITDILTVLR